MNLISYSFSKHSWHTIFLEECLPWQKHLLCGIAPCLPLVYPFSYPLTISLPLHLPPCRTWRARLWWMNWTLTGSRLLPQWSVSVCPGATTDRLSLPVSHFLFFFVVFLGTLYQLSSRGNSAGRGSNLQQANLKPILYIMLNTQCP